METKIRWGLLACGHIAHRFAAAVLESSNGTLAAVASRDAQRAAAFAQEYQVPLVFGSYEELLACTHIDAVYVSTLNPHHEQWAIAALRAGKHVLCEKPVGMNRVQVERIIAAAREAKRFLMEAFMYRCHPQTRAVVEAIRNGAIGTPQVVEAFFFFRAAFDPASRIFSKELGGGGILDIGCYPMSMSRLIAGAAIGKPYTEPSTIKASGRIGPSGVDEYAAAVASFDSGLLAQISCGVTLPRDGFARIGGAEGLITIQHPWSPSVDGRTSGYMLHRFEEKEPRTIAVPCEKGLYAAEAELAAQSILEGKHECPAMSWNDSLGNAAALDAWRKAIGLRYEEDGAEEG